MQIRSRFLYLRPSLVRSIGTAAPVAPVKAKLSKAERSERLSKTPSETIAAIRWDAEVGQMPLAEIAGKYDMSQRRVLSIVDYEVRAHIKPQKVEA